MTLKDKAPFVFKKRYPIVRRRQDLTRQERNDLSRVLHYLPALAVLRQFVDRTHRLFAAEQSKHEAWWRRAALLREASFAAVPELAEALALLSAEKFAKMIAFVHSPAHQRVRERLSNYLPSALTPSGRCCTGPFAWVPGSISVRMSTAGRPSIALKVPISSASRIR